MVDFGNTLKKLRLQAGLTQQQLADKLRVTKSVVSYYELQERYPSPEVLFKLASIFHVSTDYLLGIDHTNTLDLTGLTEEDIVVLKQLIELLKQKNQKLGI
ncbi:MAG: helix-turn-helix transcriptional regulator [Clostridia bacterium]|nr:helix-turn-helix transcriptional regulator [Clostridia bacterium]